jgi:hypothetical protein
MPIPAADAAQLELTWEPSSGSVTGYKVHYGRFSGNYDYNVDVGNSIGCTISGLQEGKTYYFAATAYNDVEESDLSEELVHTIQVNDTDESSLPNNAPKVVEAEDMSYHGNGALFNGKYWLMWANGTMNEDVDFPNSGTYRIEIKAKGDLANGVGPEMQLLIDGQDKGSVFVNTSTPETYIFEVYVAAGTREISIAFNNDYYNRSQGTDRNLFVDKIAIVSSDQVQDKNEDSFPNNAPKVVEAEDMSYHGNGALFNGEYWLMWANGTMNEDVDFPNSGTYRIEIKAKGDLANGVGPEMQFLIDGQDKGSVFVNTSTPETYIFEVYVAAGTREVSIAFNNDYYNRSQGADRNLFVDKIAIYLQ